MSFRTWLYVFAFGIALAASVAAQEVDPALKQQPVTESGQGDATNDSNEAAQPNVANSPEILAAIKGIEAAIRDLIAEEDQIETERQRKNESRDLNAQEAMAKWARWMFWATIGTAFVTLVGLILIGFTLRYTRKAAEHTEGMLIEAKATTLAAKESVTVTRKIGMSQVRPWIKCTIEMNAGLMANKGSLPFSLNVSVQNVGNGPATDTLYDVFLFESFGHSDEDAVAKLRDKMISRVETGHNRPSIIFPAESVSISRAENLIIDGSSIKSDAMGVVPAACAVAVYRIDGEKEWRCTASIFDIFVRGDVGLGHAFPMDGKAISAEGLNVVHRRNAIGT
ncbi:hypothetical protein [Sulfitobacter sabulilitoris]|uniref:Uncharacterized protein n=1 Tax=Sulfitobacter sabulilitoris TaxID=2562655 RepID=A0A5S3PM86_9RHOB|nr:hypothetical protein [Sulfitobacter sabulilitoris]TMM55396.1 hypothetical protein FDT80_07555 [Sulfitobacter sabulilitoris]